MFFRKKRKPDVTDLFLNGGIPAAASGAVGGTGANPGDVDPLALLRSSGIDTDLIPAPLLPTIASSLAMNTDETNDQAKEQAKIKVDCGSCNREVAYGKGKCMYCGKPLELPFSATGPDVPLDSATVDNDGADGDSRDTGAGKSTTSTGIDFDLGGSL
jgi:hypothetical protein